MKQTRILITPASAEMTWNLWFFKTWAIHLTALASLHRYGTSCLTVIH